MPNKVFVYGTLKRNCSNHGLLENRSEFMGKATIGEGYSCYDWHRGFPFLLADGGEGCKGELFTVDDAVLQSLDWLEGHPTMYRREECTVLDEHDIEHDAFTYIYQGPLGKAAIKIEEWGVYKF